MSRYDLTTEEGRREFGLDAAKAAFAAVQQHGRTHQNEGWYEVSVRSHVFGSFNDYCYYLASDEENVTPPARAAIARALRDHNTADTVKSFEDWCCLFIEAAGGTDEAAIVSVVLASWKYRGA